jgi:hypothetical protein
MMRRSRGRSKTTSHIATPSTVRTASERNRSKPDWAVNVATASPMTNSASSTAYLCRRIPITCPPGIRRRPWWTPVSRLHLVCDALAWLSWSPSLRASVCSIPSCASATPLYDAPCGVLELRLDDINVFVVIDFDSGIDPEAPGYLRRITVDKCYRHLRLCFIDGPADGVAAECRRQRFARGPRRTRHRSVVEPDLRICFDRQPGCEPLRRRRVQLSVTKEIVAQEPRPQPPWGPQCLQRQPSLRAC